ncbi:hypothetical protein [Streptomyces sp. NBC_01275]|uniref:hypothetical protein n=1 Tax=Streptomyces sp. NBC_01275 TaxID=2903807 RepID=UPI00338D5AD6
MDGLDFEEVDFEEVDLDGVDFDGLDLVETGFSAEPEPAEGALPEAPARAEQVGHAPHPWDCWTLVATDICCALVAWSAVDA